MSLSFEKYNKPSVLNLSLSDKKYAQYFLSQEKKSFEQDTLILFFLWLIAPASQLLRHSGHTPRIVNYVVVLFAFLPFALLAGWLLYKFKVLTLKKEIEKNAKTVISTHIEDIEVDGHNRIILHTTYEDHRTFELGNVIGKININRPITIAYLEGSNKVIDFSQ